MAVSSNYKNYNRQTRVLTEESGFSGGMLWTGNNVDATHLKTIVNYNYDDTTGFLKTRYPFVKDDTFVIRSEDEAVKDVYTISGIYNKDFIGAYNICAIDTTNNNTVAPAGWLYCFGEKQHGKYCYVSEDSLVWIFKDSDGLWHIPEYNTAGRYTEQLIGIADVVPILYDNVLYCTTAVSDASWYVNDVFNVYGLFIIEGGTYTIRRQSRTEAEATTDNNLFDNTTFTLQDRVTLIEATVSGFNAARCDQIFNYSSVQGTGTRTVTGVYLKDDVGSITLSPRLGQHVSLCIILNNVRATADAANTIVVSELIQSDDSTTVWNEVGSITVANLLNGGTIDYLVHDATIMFKLEWKNGNTVYDMLTAAFTASTVNNPVKLKPYLLQTAKGSCLWNGHAVLWDVEGALNSLFISEVDNFYYFPVPNNVAIFDTDVISCIPYMGTLLVFTADRIYRLSESKDGSFTQEVVQNNMPLNRADAPYLRAIKNMVFFKSGKYYYMVVPKADSLTNELAVAPIYKSLATWFDNPDVATKEIFEQLYPEHNYNVELQGIDNAISISNPTDIYVEQDTVSILYDVLTFYTTVKDGTMSGMQSSNYMLFVNYNTNTRAWTMCVEDCTTMKLYPANLTAARLMCFVGVGDDDSLCLKTMRVPVLNEDYTDADSVTELYGVRCMIDTGCRLLSSALKKRFREVQLKVYNEREDNTQFGSAFYIDGVTRRAYMEYEQVLSTDTNPTICLAPVPKYDVDSFIKELSMPFDEQGNLLIEPEQRGSDSIELTDWYLDFSHFKRNAPITVRIPVSGKGYSPRFILMIPHALGLYVNEINWVYRVMYGR